MVDDLKTGKFVWYKFDAPDNWVICKLTKIVSNSQDFNCMVHCCADNDTYKVFLNQGLYTAAPSIDSPFIFTVLVEEENFTTCWL